MRFFAIILCFVFFHGVTSAPLKALVQDGSPGNIASIKEATEVANGQIKNMQAVLDGDNPQAHPAVIKAFGTNANIDEIKKNVANLGTGKIKVPTADAVEGLTQGATNTRSKDVSFGSVFFNSDAKQRAGTVIHEASHALNGAVDHFDPNGDPHHQGTEFDRGKAQVGYKDSHLDQLKEQASHNMHHNADSYRVFAEECPQARELFRRALEERDPETQAHLIRRGALACAWHPKGASKANAAGSKVATKPVVNKAGSKGVSKAPGSGAATRQKAGAKGASTIKASGSRAATRPKGAAKGVSKVKAPGSRAATRQKAGSKGVPKVKAAGSKGAAKPVAKTAGSRRPVQARPVANSKRAAAVKAAPKKTGRK